MRLNAKLVRGRSRDAVKELEDRYVNAALLLDAITGALTEELESAIIRDEDTDQYMCPNLTHRLADNAGYRRGLRLALSLLNPTVTK